MHRVERIDMFAAMIEKHERLRQARENAGYKYASEAADALGMTPSTYRAHENGQNDFGLEEAEVYAKKFGADPLWIMGSHIKPLSSAPPPENIISISKATHDLFDSPNARIGNTIVGAGRLIPVYGQAVGGVDGEFEMNGNILYQVMAPPIISEVTNAYAVSVAGESMWPRYEDGEVCFVDPRRRVRKGDYVIAQIRIDDHSAPLAYVKRFLRHNADELVLEQFNPAKELRFDARMVVSVHYIALAGNA